MVRLAARLSPLAVGLSLIDSMPLASAQPSQVAAEWALFYQILYIGIAVGIVVFGLLFYAIIRYREKPTERGAE